MSRSSPIKQENRDPLPKITKTNGSRRLAGFPFVTAVVERVLGMPGLKIDPKALRSGGVPLGQTGERIH